MKSICSVLLPFRDAAATIGECLDSIQQQTEPRYEILAIDDHSQDGSRAIVAQRADLDPRIRLIDAAGNGLVDALNQGLAMAETEVVVRIDADDRMLPDRIRRQQDWLRDHPDIPVVGSLVRKFPRDLLAAGYRAYEAWLNATLSPEAIAADIYVESPLAHPSVMFRKEVIEAAGGYRQGPFPEDYELWLRLHHAGYRFGKVDEVLLEWRESPDRTSRIDPRYSRAAFDRLRAGYLVEDTRVQGAEGIVVWGAGRKSRQRVRLAVEAGLDFRAWIDIDPRKIGGALWDRPIHQPEWLESRSELVLCYVTNHGAREQIAEFLDKLGRRRGKDYLFVG